MTRRETICGCAAVAAQTSFATDPARAIATDTANNFYITGDYTGMASFDGLSLSNAGLRDVFVAKYNSNGVIQWLHHGGGPHAEEAHSIAVDQSGNSWVTGFLGSGPNVVFDGLSLPPRGNEYVFLAKYDTSGVVQYVKQYAAGLGQDIHVLNNGCLYFGGERQKRRRVMNLTTSVWSTWTGVGSPANSVNQRRSPRALSLENAGGHYV